jgi:hypothetical protein
MIIVFAFFASVASEKKSPMPWERSINPTSLYENQTSH